MARKTETQVERTHGHCADVLMDDYGIPKHMRVQVCEEIAKVWVQVTMIHCLIISSVRGYQPSSATRGLEMFLSRHSTRSSPKNRKPESRMAARRDGTFDSRGYYHPPEDDY